MNKRSLGGGLLIAALGVVGTWAYCHAPTTAQDRSITTARRAVELPLQRSSDRAGSSGDEIDEAPELPGEPSDEAPVSPAQARAGSIEQLQKSLRIYQEFAVYPPWSRPYGEATLHYVDWNKLRPEGQPFAVDEENRELSVEVSLDRMFAGPGEAIRALVKLGRRENGVLVPASFDQVTARIEWNERGKGYSLAQALSLTQQRTDYTTSFVPSQIPVLAAGPREAMVTVEVKRGVFFKEIRMPFQYAVKPVFQVHGIAGERVANGSLVIDLDVEAAYATPTLIQAVLYDRSGKTPIAVYDDYFRPVKAGRQVATITFFGKALREKNVVGPYSVRALHGVSKDPGADSPEIFWKRDDALPLVTTLYYPTQFSDAEWSAPEKDAKIAQYEALIRAGGL
jgi:hypothetical protein